MLIWFLSSGPLGKILTGQSTLGCFKIPLVGIQNPGPQNFWEVIQRRLSRFIALLHVFPDVLNFIPQTWHTNWISVTIHARNHCESKQQDTLSKEAAQNWAIEKLPESYQQPLLGKVKTAGQGFGFRASSEG